MSIDGIIFDLDGTLWDSTRPVAESWNNTVWEEYGLEGWFTPESVTAVMGMTDRDIAKTLFSRCGERAMEVCMTCLLGECPYIASHGGELYPGVEELLCTLSREYPLFIVSNCQRGYIEAFLANTGFSKYITDIECEGNTGLEKAENIALLAHRRGLKAPVYVGDTANDQRSAVKAGCRFIHASYGFGTAEAPCPAITTPAELPAVLKTLG